MGLNEEIKCDLDTLIRMILKESDIRMLDYIQKASEEAYRLFPSETNELLLKKITELIGQQKNRIKKASNAINN